MKQDAQMTRSDALQLLGESPTRAAMLIGITPQAISQWPAVLTPILRDRVQAALYRELMSSRRRRAPLQPPSKP